ncbi:MAG: hypothetical protein RL131_1187 [Bacteroidota bacterium]
MYARDIFSTICEQNYLCQMPVLVTEKFDTYSICLWDIQEDEPFFRQQLNFTPSASHAAIALQQWGARMALKTLEPDFPFQHVQKNEYQRPFLADNSFQFSFSHCSGFGAAAISKTHAIGTDVEKISERVLKVLPRFLNERENKYIQGLSQEDQIRMSTLFWTIKESAFKALGRPGVDFKTDIQIHAELPNEQLECFVEFRDKPSVLYPVYQNCIRGVWLTALSMEQ